MRQAVARGVSGLAVGLAELDPALADLGAVLDDLLGSFSTLGT